MPIIDKNIITEIINSLFKDLKKNFSEKSEILKIELIDEKGCSNSIKYFEILLKDSYLNERDIDLFDLEISYQVFDNENASIKCELYSSEGEIFSEIKLDSDNILEIKQNLTDFIIAFKNNYDVIIKDYLK